MFSIGRPTTRIKNGPTAGTGCRRCTGDAVQSVALRITILAASLAIATSGSVPGRPNTPSTKESRQRLLRTGRCIACNLRRSVLNSCPKQPCRADLRGVDLSRADLSGADLSRANLQRAVFQGATMRGTRLGGADLRLADLRKADLRKADLSGALLQGAALAGADLRGSNLSGADLAFVDIAGARLEGAVFKDTFLPDGRKCSGECAAQAAP